MGTNNINRTSSSPHPMYGIRPGFNISDLDCASGGFALAALTNVTTASTSAALQGGRFVVISPVIADSAISFTVTLSTWNGTTATPVFSMTNVTRLTSEIFVGGYEGVDLQGGQFKISISSVVNPNTANITINYKLNG